MASLPSRVTETCSGSSRVVILTAAFSADAESAVASAMAARPSSSACGREVVEGDFSGREDAERGFGEEGVIVGDDAECEPDGGRECDVFLRGEF